MPAYRVKLRRGTSAEHANFVGAEGEVTVDTDKKRLVVHDGVTPGGFLIAALEDVKTDISEYTDSEGLMGGYTYDVQGTELPLTSTSPIVNYTVTVASGFRYNGRGIPGGPGNVFYLRNDTAGETEFTENPHITLQTGYTYVFDMSDASNSGHPLQFTTDMGQTAFTSGVTTLGTAGQAGATVTFTVPSPRPLNLMYYCGVHGAGMGGEITVGSDAYVAPSEGPTGSSASTTGWIVRSNFTGMSNERFYDVTTDSNNNFFAVGYDAVDDDILLASYDTDGTFRWASTAGDNLGPDRISECATDSSGNIIAVGYSYGHNNGNFPYEGLITKYQGDGTHVFTKVFKSSDNKPFIIDGVTTDSEDNIYLTGRGKTQSNVPNDEDYTFVAKIDSSAAVQWVRKLDHTGQQSAGKEMRMGSDGNLVILAGIHEDRSGYGYSSVLVAKMNASDGSLIWYKIMMDANPSTGVHNDQFAGLDLDSNNDIFISGWTQVDGAAPYYTGIIKISGADGSVVWQRRHLTQDGSRGIAVDSSDNIYVITDSKLLLSYSNEGVLNGEWEISSVSGGSYYLYNIILDQNGNVALTGMRYLNSQAEPYIAKLPATISAGTYDDLVITDSQIGDTDGSLQVATFSTIVSNAVTGTSTANANNMAPSTQAATHNISSIS